MITDKINHIDFEEVEYTIKDITELIMEDDYEGAKEVLTELLDETSGIYEEDSRERYFCFDSPIQYYLYEHIADPGKFMNRSRIDYRTLHMCFAHILVSEGDDEAAEDEYKRAMYWNPVDCDIFFALAGLYLKQESESKFSIVMDAVHSYILSSHSLAQYYALLGSYYLRLEKYDISEALFYLSQSIKDTARAEEGIERISQLERRDIAPPATEELIEELRKDGFQFGLNPQILRLLYDLSADMKMKLNSKGAAECLYILYDITGDERYRRELEFLE